MKKILIVDDSTYICDVLKKILDQGQFVFLIAKEGQEALDIFKKELPDLVLLDILMPKMDGISALKQMKNIKPEFKVIIISAVEQDEIESQIAQYNVEGYFTKPFDINIVRKQVNEVLGI